MIDAATLAREIEGLRQQGRRARLIVCSAEDCEMLCRDVLAGSAPSKGSAWRRQFMGVPIEIIDLRPGVNVLRHVWDDQEYQEFLDRRAALQYRRCLARRDGQ
jgi:hypothetical protein